MTGENEIQILITAVDNMSAVMTKVEANLDKSNKAIQKQSEATSKGFQEQTGNLLILGQAVNSADRIWSSYQNMQLRIENATERVTGAQDRLADAQYELNKLMKSGVASAEDLQNAQRKVESASRGLTIAQNNLQRAQNKVFGTYVSMGLQAVTLIASFGKVKLAIIAMTKASWAFIASPLGVVLAAIAVAVGIGLWLWNDYKKKEEAVTIATEELNIANDNLIIAQESVVNAVKEVESAEKDLKEGEKELLKVQEELLELQKDLTDETDNWAEALKETDDFMRGIITTHSKEENKLLLQIEKKRHEINVSKLAGDTEEAIKIKEDELSALELQHQVQFEDVRALAEAELAITENKTREKYGIEKESTEATEALYKTGYANVGVFLEEIFYPKLQVMWEESNTKELKAYNEKIDEEMKAQQRLFDLQDRVKKSHDNVTKANSDVANSINAVNTATTNLGTATKEAEKGFWGRLLETIAKPALMLGLPMFQKGGYVPQTGPAILHKGEYVVPENDVGKNNGYNMTIVIEGDNYGVNADEIAEALANKIGNTIRL